MQKIVAFTDITHWSSPSKWSQGILKLGWWGCPDSVMMDSDCSALWSRSSVPCVHSFKKPFWNYSSLKTIRCISSLKCCGGYTRLASDGRRLTDLYLFAQVSSSPQDTNTGRKAAALSLAGNRRFHACVNEPECFHTSVFWSAVPLPNLHSTLHVVAFVLNCSFQWHDWLLPYSYVEKKKQ